MPDTSMIEDNLYVSRAARGARGRYGLPVFLQREAGTDHLFKSYLWREA